MSFDALTALRIGIAYYYYPVICDPPFKPWSHRPTRLDQLNKTVLLSWIGSGDVISFQLLRILDDWTMLLEGGQIDVKYTDFD